MQKQFTWTGNPAFRQGLLFGILLGLFPIVLNVMLSLAGLSTLFIGALETTFTGIGHFISIVSLIVTILAYLLAGRCASQHTGKLGTGALAGLGTALIGAVITLRYVCVFYATKGPSPTIAPPLSAMVINAILSIPVAVLAGACVGVRQV